MAVAFPVGVCVYFECLSLFCQEIQERVEPVAEFKPAEKALAARDFKDTAYFEPFYLKQFQATVSKKKIF